MLKRNIMKTPHRVPARDIRTLIPEYGIEVTYLLIDLEQSPSILDEIMLGDLGDTRGLLVLLSSHIERAIKQYAWIITQNETFTFLKLKYSEQLTSAYSDREMCLILDHLTAEYPSPSINTLTVFVAEHYSGSLMSDLLSG